MHRIVSYRRAKSPSIFSIVSKNQNKTKRAPIQLTSIPSDDEINGGAEVHLKESVTHEVLKFYLHDAARNQGPAHQALWISSTSLGAWTRPVRPSFLRHVSWLE